jgi:hypothetical protein
MFDRSKLQRKDIKGIVISAVGSGLVIIVVRVLDLLPLSVIITAAVTFVCTVSVFIIRIHLKEKLSEELNSVLALGIIGLWRDETHFKKDRGISYAEYCREFIRNTPDGQKIRLFGYDWIELLADTTILGSDVLEPTGGSRIYFDVILADPKSPMVFEKRIREMTWETPYGELIYPEGKGKGSYTRLQTKIQSCLSVVDIFASQRPETFRRKLTPTMPCFSLLMNDDTVIGVMYSLPHKGKDTLIFEAKRVTVSKLNSRSSRAYVTYGTDFYGFLKGYFEAMWNDPTWKCVKVMLNERDFYEKEGNDG